jgi:formamidopyrimidine-DNA glycosylase
MPELAEVEYFRRQWDPGLGHRVVRVSLHARKRVFRGTNARALQRELTGTRLLSSAARGKRMLFRFSNDNWLGLHLGMTGRLEIASPNFHPQKHHHLVLFQPGRALVFRDSRQFGRVQFHHSTTAPGWWDETVPEIVSLQFTRAFLDRFLTRHSKAPIKAVLLMQSGFSGIGNWMADEILWRAKIFPARRAGELNENERARLFRAIRFVARRSLRIIGPDDLDLPRDWLIHQRWRAGGKCPRHGTILRRETIAGRTTAWCPKCQYPERSRGIPLRNL